MHDAIQLERQGVPATLIITEPFQGLAASFAGTLGAPAYHNAMVRHPISSKGLDHLREQARSVAGVVVAQLTAS